MLLSTCSWTHGQFRTGARPIVVTRNNNANCHAASGRPDRRRPGVHAGEVSLRPLSPRADARLAVRNQEEPIPGQRRPAGSVRRAGRPTTASRMAGRCIMRGV